MALSLYPSNGLALHGFESKISRADLKKELLDPSKAAEFSEYCDYWWLVLSSEELMAGLQCPESWGVLVPSGKSLKVAIQAPKLNPKPMDIGLVCGLLRKASETSDKVLKGMVPREDIMSLAEEKAKEIADRETKGLRAEFDLVNRYISEFKDASGVDIRERWQMGRIGNAVKHIVEQGRVSVIEKAKCEAVSAKKYLDQLNGFLESMKGELL
jgi:hypothetical protein